MTAEHEYVEVVVRVHKKGNVTEETLFPIPDLVDLNTAELTSKLDIAAKESEFKRISHIALEAAKYGWENYAVIPEVYRHPEANYVEKNQILVPHEYLLLFKRPLPAKRDA